MSLGKHVYCQKPLTHSIYEARVMEQAARYYKVQTQMGNQAHAGEPIRRAVEMVRAGIIGPVREVHAWTNRPIWPQGQAALDERQRLADQPKPDDLDWDVWLGPAPLRTYNAYYVPFRWRGWWDFGCGALGDMACHTANMAFMSCNLGFPTSVEAECSEFNPAEDRIRPERTRHARAWLKNVGLAATGCAASGFAGAPRPSI